MAGAMFVFSGYTRGAVLSQNARVGGAKGVTSALHRLRGHSVERAPVDAGDLRASGSVIPAQPTAAPEGQLVFDTAYAAKQHEVEMNHTPGQNGEPAGEDHYVTKNIPVHRNEYRDLIGADMKRTMGT